MKKVGVTGLVIAGISLAAWTPVQAHHSTAEFDYTKENAVVGIVKEFQFTNPHCWVYVTVDEGGKKVEYAFETGAPNVSVRMGWRRNSLKPGDKVRITYAPVRNGEPKGTLKTASLPDGTVLYGVAYNFAKQFRK